MSKRAHVYGLLRDRRLRDAFERGGNRAYQPANQDLRFGPDLGGASVAGDEGKYLPAFERYNGRFYVPLKKEAREAADQNRGKVRVLIMSGLYGLIEHDEWIQNYDVHLSDADTESGSTISSMWSELFTKCLSSYVNQAHSNRKVRILNLLCDHRYTDAVQWHALPSECSVFHLASPTLNDVDLLPAAGFLLNSLLLAPDSIQNLERDGKLYELSAFGLPPEGLAGTQIFFESRVGLSRRTDVA